LAKNRRYGHLRLPCDGNLVEIRDPKELKKDMGSERRSEQLDFYDASRGIA
jgi:hypothetical protein